MFMVEVFFLVFQLTMVSVEEEGFTALERWDESFKKLKQKSDIECKDVN